MDWSIKIFCLLVKNLILIDSEEVGVGCDVYLKLFININLIVINKKYMV